MGPTPKQPLPAKEESLFKQVVKLHEGRQYKKALKLVDQILKKCPNHGETLAMKGINLFCMHPERRSEAHEIAKAALKADMQSHMCWHVFGILHKSDRDYQQAVKCYLNALKWDPENLNLFRELSNIQMQIRDVKGLVETASKMLSLRSTNRNNWMLLAVAHHLDKNHSTAAEVLESYLKTQEGNGAHEAGGPVQDRVEISEIQLYRAQILHEGGQHEAALKLLSDSAPRICDRLGSLQLQASLELASGNLEEAANLYRRLINAIPDNYDYHRGLCKAMELGDDEPSAEVVGKLTSVYAELAEQYPKCNAVQRIPLDFLSGEKFAKAARNRIHSFAKKGVWALFSDLRPLLATPAKEQLLWQQAQEVLKEASGEEVVWLQLYLAQHACHMGRMSAAVEHVTAAEAAVGDSDARVEVCCTKADVLAAVGDPEGAARAADAAQKLDNKDRYVNSMAAKYMFRNGEVTRAKDTALVFTRGSGKEDSGPSDLFEMQVMWFEIESGRAHFKLGDMGMALKMFRAVLTHFDEFREDQWDFHGYCLRKATLRAYIDMLTMEDGIYSAQAYRDAAVGAIQCYISLHDSPPGAEAAAAETKKMQDMTDAQKKKFLDKKKKEAAKAAKAEAEKLEKDRAAHNAKKSSVKFDEDPLGKKLMAVEQPLAEADKLVQMLKTHAPQDMRTHVAAYDVAQRQDKPHLALKAAKAAAELDEASADAHLLRVRALLWLEKRLPQIEIQVAREGMQADLQKLTDGKKWGDLNEAFLKQAGGKSAPLCAHFAYAKVQAEATGDAAAAAKVLAGVRLSQVAHNVSECMEVHSWMQSISGADQSSKAFFSQAQAAHPFSAEFSGAQRLPLPVDKLSDSMRALSTGEDKSS